MHAIDTAAAVNGQFTDGDPLVGIPATAADALWLNDLQNNILYVLTEAKVATAKGDATQLYSAIETLIAAAISGISPSSGGGGGGAPATAVNQVAPYGMPTRAPIPGTVDDANALFASGFYLGTGAVNLPATATAGVLIVAGNTTAGATDGGQVYIDATGLTWTRGRTSAGWGAWNSVNAQHVVQLGVNGYDWDPSTGEFIQWGLMQGPFSEGAVNVAFPIAFDTCFGIKGWVVNSSADVTVGTWIDEVSVAGNQATVLVNRVSSGSPNIPAFKWESRGQRLLHP